MVDPRIGHDVSELSDDDIDHLLSQGRLGRAHKERLLRRVLGSIPSPPVTVDRPSRRRWHVLGVLPLACGAVILALWWRPNGERGSSFRAKGTPALAPVVGMSCLGGSVRACPSGSRIAFWLEGGTQETGFITAYADPAGGGERVWYLTNEPASAVSANLPGSPSVVPKAAVIGREQSSGRYGVHVIFTRRPVAHADLRRLSPAETVTRADFDLVVSP